jgi:S1-C subfamily serine protease
MKKMKKLLTILVSVFAVTVFTSCSIADNFENTTAPQTIYETKYITNTIRETLDINALYEIYKTENPDATFADFIQYLSLSVSDTEYAASIGLKSVVSIFDIFHCRQYYYWHGREYYEDYSVQGAGSGVIYQITDGTVYIVTNYHVVYNAESKASNRIADEISLFLYNAESTAITASFVGGDADKDIAVLKADKSGFADNISAAVLADTVQLKMGQTAVAIGNSLGEGLKVTAGVISDPDTEITMEALDADDEDGEITLNLIQTDTTINAGNSGGGLFNARGELMGIVNAKMVSAGVENTGYAIPLNAANRKIIDGIIDGDSA